MQTAKGIIDGTIAAARTNGLAANRDERSHTDDADPRLMGERQRPMEFLDRAKRLWISQHVMVRPGHTRDNKQHHNGFTSWGETHGGAHTGLHFSCPGLRDSLMEEVDWRQL
jgi:hypothetical protein